MSDEKTAWALLDQGRADRAFQLTSQLLGQGRRSGSALMAHAQALKALGRAREALPFNREAVQLNPNDRIAWYNLAAISGDLDLVAESEQAVRRAMSLGLAAPEAHLVLARALQLQDRYDEAETAYRAAIALRPAYAEAHRDLAQLIWMRTTDIGQALAPLDTAIGAAPADPNLYYWRAVVQETAGDLEGAAATLARGLSRAPGDIELLVKASRVSSARAMTNDALKFARQALAVDNSAYGAHEALCLAALAAGDPRQGAQLAERLLAASPFNQMALALHATALRMTGDPRYRELYDYERVVGAYMIETPPGWPDLPAFLADLSRALEGMHRLETHPLQQSLRHGTQVQSLLASTDPVISAFFKAADQAIGKHLEFIGREDDPLRSRNSGQATIYSAWSVSLRPKGFHVNHVHPEGWLSTAFYVETPDSALDTPRREGWIKFGQPGVLTSPRLEPEHFVRPKPGLLVVFPSYMWHGTVPFTSDERRLTIAFDIVPS